MFQPWCLLLPARDTCVPALVHFFFDGRKKAGKGKGNRPSGNPSTALSRARHAEKDANQFLTKPTLRIGRSNGACRAVGNCKWCHSEDEAHRVKESEARNTAPTTYLVRNQGLTPPVHPPSTPKAPAFRAPYYGTAFQVFTF